MAQRERIGYGITSILLHWLSAVAVVGLFALGVWMVELTYYSAWYQDAPHIHKSIGILLLVLTFCRLVWRLITPKVAHESQHKAWEIKLASLVHGLIYCLLFSIMVTGILISTADGRGIWVFNWFEVPSLGALFENQADIAGAIHQYFAYSLIGLVVLHGAGALKHHFIDKDQTLLKMCKPNRG